MLKPTAEAPKKRGRKPGVPNKGPKLSKKDPAHKILADPSARKSKPEDFDRITRALFMRKGGGDYLNIAKNIGVSEAEARNMVVEELRWMREHLQEDLIDHMTLQYERLNDMLLGIWGQKSNPRIIATILAIMARQDQLKGLITERVEVVLKKQGVEGLSDEELDKVLANYAKYTSRPEPIDYSGEEGVDAL